MDSLRDNIKYAGFWRRLVAFIIDLVLVIFILWIIAYTLSHVIPQIKGEIGDQESVFKGVVGLIIVLTFIPIPWLYWAILESSSSQATLGKMALGIIVTDLDGNRVSFNKASLRFWGKILSGWILNIGYIMAAFTKKKQALHDIIAKCLVVRRSPTNRSS